MKPYLGMVAWPTVFVAMAIVAAFATVTTLGTMHIIPLWLGLILNTFILYLDQTPLHEACHGNIAGKDSRFLWLNHLVGFVCGAILLHEYKAFRYMHLAHHRDTNDTEIDPDIGWRCRALQRAVPLLHHRFWYHQYFWKHIAFHAHIPGMRPLTIHIAAMYALLYSVAFGLSVYGYWREVLMLWIVPHIVASAMIIYFFAYLTHKPHEVHERYRDTNVFWVKGKIARAGRRTGSTCSRTSTSSITSSRAFPSISIRRRSAR